MAAPNRDPGRWLDVGMTVFIVLLFIGSLVGAVVAFVTQ